MWPPTNHVVHARVSLDSSSRLRSTLRMRMIGLCLPVLCLAVLLLPGGDNAVSAQVAQKPNIVFILTDDMRYDDLEYIPKIRSLLGSEGMSFDQAFVSNALCCPSRATIMLGQYAHNTGVWFNQRGPNGAWEGYKYNGGESEQALRLPSTRMTSLTNLPSYSRYLV
jgi:hypothetical protein